MRIQLTITVLLILIMTNMKSQNCFPFGEELKKVVQKDTTPKKIFVLGVYASAVHAKWVDKDDSVIIRAIAVASEPEIFWRGDYAKAKEIIDRIKIPEEYGKLIPADTNMNGPSGRSLDVNYIIPLGYQRSDAWLCDLVPYSCRNPNQDKALKREYDIRIGLPKYSIPEVPKVLANSERINEIMLELKQSKARIIILLGDQPIKYFLSPLTNNKYNKLTDFFEYGKPIEIIIDGEKYSVYAFAHPRQTSKLGTANMKWYEIHNNWKNQSSNKPSR